MPSRTPPRTHSCHVPPPRRRSKPHIQEHPSLVSLGRQTSPVEVWRRGRSRPPGEGGWGTRYAFTSICPEAPEGAGTGPGREPIAYRGVKHGATGQGHAGEGLFARGRRLPTWCGSGPDDGAGAGWLGGRRRRRARGSDLLLLRPPPQAQATAANTRNTPTSRERPTVTPPIYTTRPKDYDPYNGGATPICQ
jgi:hypothetical protein